MKKIFGISLMGLLAMSPMMAHAAPVAGDPGATVTSGASVAGSAPKYALKEADGDDGKAATAGYVKGAYNAVIKGVNKTHDEIGTLNTGITTYANAIDHLTDGKATKAGTVATIKSATTTESINDSTVNITGVTTTSISATASGNVNLSVPAMSDWENDSEAANPVQTTTTFSGLAVDNLTMSAPGTNNTATLTKGGIGGTVDVLEYLASAGFDFTPLINSNGDGYTESGNSWTVTWNDYGTVRGISACLSSKYGKSFGGTVSDLHDNNELVVGGETNGQYCWCKMTGFTAKDGTTYNDTSLWAFDNTYEASYCAANCADSCGGHVQGYSKLRAGMFGSVQN